VLIANTSIDRTSPAGIDRLGGEALRVGGEVVGMSDFEEIAKGVFVHPSALYQVQTVVIVKPDDAWVVDPAFFPEEIERARALVEANAAKGARRHLLLTHSDFDHTAGSYAFPGFRTVASADWDPANEREGRAYLRSFDEEHYVERPAVAYDPLPDGDRVEEDGCDIGGLSLFPSTGHQRDGLFALDGASGTFLVGDFLSAIEFPFIYTGFRSYVESFLKMARIIAANDIRHVVSEHGPVAHAPDAWQGRLADDALYLLTLYEEAKELPGRILGHPHAPKVLAAETMLAWRAEPFSPSILGYHEENAKAALEAAHEGLPDALTDGLKELAGG